jgi:hypothetical protein
MALQIRRGTNAQRLLYTPIVGELVFVTDYLSADVDPIYVGDGATLGGVAVGQNAVLAGSMEGDIILNNNDITGSGNLEFTGNINHVGNITTKKITITGNGGVAVVSTGSITNTGNVNISGNIISSGTIQAVTTESDLVGNVLSSDSSEVLVNATNNTFSGNSLSVRNVGAGSISTLSGNSLIHQNNDDFVNFDFGSESQPFSFTQYEQQPNVHYGRITTADGGGLTLPGTQDFTVYRGTLDDPDNIQTGDKLGGMYFRSYNLKGVPPAPGGIPRADAVPGLGGVIGFIAEDQAGANPGSIPSTLVLGSGFGDLNNFFSNPLSDTNDVLKYSSKGELKVTALNLRALSNAERTALSPFINDGTIIYNYEPTDSNGDPLGLAGLQVRIGGGWYNIPVSGASNL